MNNNCGIVDTDNFKFQISNFKFQISNFKLMG